MAGRSPSPGALQGLPTLRLRSSFRNLPRAERILFPLAAILLPLASFGAAVGLAASGQPRLQGYAPFVALFGVVFLFFFAYNFFPETVVLSPTLVEARRGLRRTSLDPLQVEYAMTGLRGRRRVHILAAPTGKAVAFGPGLRSEDFEVARRWMADLAASLGKQYRGDMDFREALALIMQSSR